MASNEAKVIITAEDKTSAGIKSAQSGFASFAKTAKSFAGPLVAVFATKKILDFGVSSVKAFADAEASMAIFETTLKTMGNQGKEMRTALLEASSAVTKLGFDDEASAVSMAKFAKATGSSTEAIKLNQLTMDIARGKNMDFESAQKVVTLALAGSTKEIRAMGLAVEEGISPIEIITQLQKTYAGQAEAFASTSKGSMEVLTNTWGDFKEVIGATLAEAITPFIRDISAFVSDPRFIEFMGQLATAVGVTLKGAVWVAKTAFDGWYQIINSTWQLMMAVHSWIQDTFIKTVDYLSDKIVSAMQAVQNLINKLNELSIVQSAKSFISNVVGGAGIATSAVKGLFKADGGPVSANSPYIVGERGPELFTPSSSGMITPNNRLAGVGGITINISGNTLLDRNSGDILAEQIMRTLKQNLRI